METITLEQFSYIAEVVASVAVIASLLYVAAQIRQDTRQRRLETIQVISSEFNGWYDTLASNRELAEMWHRGLFDYQSLDATERVQFTLLTVRILRTWHEQYFQWREGVMDADFWQSWVALLEDLIQYPGWKEVWLRRHHQFTKDFQGFVDKLIAETKDIKPLYEPPAS